MKTSLKVGDKVMVIAGGNHVKRANRGKVGRLLRFVGEERDRVIVEGINFCAKHRRAQKVGQAAGKVVVEAPLHISNVLYFAEKIKRPVRLCHKQLTDGSKVRGFRDPKSKEFVQI